MKTKLLLLISCLSILSGCCRNTPVCQPTWNYSFPTYTCQCTDPQCISCNPCLSRYKCCKYFGNIGARCPNYACDPLTIGEITCDCISYEANRC